jgi:hypothetical protein
LKPIAKLSAKREKEYKKEKTLLLCPAEPEENTMGRLGHAREMAREHYKTKCVAFAVALATDMLVDSDTGPQCQ